MENNSNFSITGNKGFQIKFDNGYIVSIQFGPMNYCENRSFFKLNPDVDARGNVTCENAETAVFHSVTGEWANPPWSDNGDTVQGWQSPADVAKLIAWAASLPAPSERNKNADEMV